ncbi:MAG: glutamate-5-semialdehyde dehydrogenase [Deltaproteobacteria bacterium]|jgi:glutamate-5-semialdehyde dehydrogenase|nr:glutamate-5-semialdehyde dehydrogenase [Deltaproteobacteria bacterium]
MTLTNLAQRAKDSLPTLFSSSSNTRNLALTTLARLLIERMDELISANQEDVEKARGSGFPEPLIDRLELNQTRVAGLAKGIQEVAALPDPLGAVEDLKVVESGLRVGRMRVPLGLIAFICEARPGAVAEAAAMALKSGNGLLVKPGKEAKNSSKCIGSLIGEALSQAQLSGDLVAVLSGTGREDLVELLKLSDYVDLVIPRGGEGLIRFVAENSRIPVLKHFKGVCHLYVDKGADLDMAVSLIINGKANRPGTCNALECLLVNQDEATQLFPRLIPLFKDNGIKIRAHESAYSHLEGHLGSLLQKADDSDWGKEYLDLTLSVKLVTNMEEALEHIRLYGSQHTEVIVTRDLIRAEEFVKKADAGCVMVNASTRLNDGGCLGLGAEIGISTSKLQAYGPMGLQELTTRKFVVLGQGQIRS